MKVFKVTFGRDHQVSGHVRAVSQDALRTALFEIGWPLFSLVTEIPVMEISELQEHLARLQPAAA